MVTYKPKEEDKIQGVKDIPGILAIVSANNFKKEDC